jgi:MFS family permease
MTLNSSLTKSTVVAALGGLLFGFDTAVISGTTAGLTQQYGLSPSLLGDTVSIALWGTVVGSIFAGIPGDKLGAAGQSADHGDSLSDFSFGLRRGLELGRPDGDPVHWRLGNWWLVGAGTHVHCRDCSGQVAWAPCGIVPV